MNSGNGIDDALVRPSADETVLLGNGCLCCITRSDLQQALRRMVIERERGELPDFRRYRDRDQRTR
jgi:G3E family GTPase